MSNLNDVAGRFARRFLTKYRPEDTTVPWFRDSPDRDGVSVEEGNRESPNPPFIAMSDPRSRHARAYGRCETAYPNTTGEMLAQDMKIGEGVFCAAVALALGLFLGAFAGCSSQMGANASEVAQATAEKDAALEQLAEAQADNERLSAELAAATPATEEAPDSVMEEVR